MLPLPRDAGTSGRMRKPIQTARPRPVTVKAEKPHSRRNYPLRASTVQKVIGQVRSARGLMSRSTLAPRVRNADPQGESTPA